MVEIGYAVNNGPLHTHSAGREWSKEILQHYEIQKLYTNEIIQEGRRKELWTSS